MRPKVIPPPGERERHIAWRRSCLRHAGYDAESAMRIANDPAYDLHALLDLVDRGCPPELALRIAAPLGSEAGS